ncbi:MAG: DUF1049 domain-containing protein, partial [Methanocalculus sp. MSAO_Arc1]
VVYYWMMNIERIPMTILTGLLIMSGLIIFMFGVLGDMLLAYHRETGRELRKLQKKIDRLEKERE